MATKQRLSASVDSDLVEAARAAEAEGRAPSVSAWVNEALRRHVEHERGLHAMDEFLAAEEAEHGPITEEEMEAVEQWMRERTIVSDPSTWKAPADPSAA
jgi:Arc/MetJ-type ribon-helix-helix transcriptional regulator